MKQLPEKEIFEYLILDTLVCMRYMDDQSESMINLVLVDSRESVFCNHKDSNKNVDAFLAARLRKIAEKAHPNLSKRSPM